MNNTIFKNIHIYDNILDNPYEAIDMLHNVNYYSNEENVLPGFNLNVSGDKPSGIWRGYRSEPLHRVSVPFFEKVNNEIFSKLLGTDQFNFIASSYLHLGDASIDAENLWHSDTNALFAYVLYLNPNPPSNTGTLIEEDGNIIEVENKFNRLVFYRGSLKHRPENFFGKTFHESRLTLISFIEQILISR